MTSPGRQGPVGEVLVVIDMQRVFADRDSPWRTPGFDEVLPRVRALADAYGYQVVHTRFVAPAEPAGAWVAYYETWPFALQPRDADLWQIVAALAPARHVVDAATFGKWGAELAARVAAASPHRAPSILLAGVSTDCCVLSTALAAADAGVRVRVAGDACAGVTSDDHDRALAAMALYAPLIELTDTATVLAEDR